MREGAILADGRPLEALAPEILADAFHLRAHLEIGTEGVIFQPLEALSAS